MFVFGAHFPQKISPSKTFLKSKVHPVFSATLDNGWGVGVRGKRFSELYANNIKQHKERESG